MKLFMNIAPYAVISIETLLFGSDNITDETNLIVLTNVQIYIYHTKRFAFNPLSSFFPTISVYQIYLCIHLLYM